MRDLTVLFAEAVGHDVPGAEDVDGESGAVVRRPRGQGLDAGLVVPVERRFLRLRV